MEANSGIAFGVLLPNFNSEHDLKNFYDNINKD